MISQSGRNPILAWNGGKNRTVYSIYMYGKIAQSIGIIYSNRVGGIVFPKKNRGITAGATLPDKKTNKYIFQEQLQCTTRTTNGLSCTLPVPTSKIPTNALHF